MAEAVIESPFYAPSRLEYPGGDNVVDPTKTVIIKYGKKQQTVTFNAAGLPLQASALTPI